jgi:hypothetical protein
MPSLISGAVSPLAAYLRLRRKLEPTPKMERGGILEPADSYLSTTHVTWIEFGFSLGLEEME